MNYITITGPNSRGGSGAWINTTSKAVGWSRGLSPFLLGPCALYDEYVSQTMENAWQYSKVYDEVGYWDWARKGWANRNAVRYPMGKGAIPKYSLWDGKEYGYIDARKHIYFPLYRDAVRDTDAFKRLKEEATERDLLLFDFDGYDHNRLGMSLSQALNNERRKFGHSFVLKAMLLYGDDVEWYDLPDEDTQ